MSEQYRCTECGHFVEIRDDVICDVCHIGKMEHLRYIKGGNGSHWEGCEEVHWDCRIAQLETELARLTAELAELRERFEVTDDLLNQATVTIGAVIACCTYNSNEDAKIGIYGISPDAFTRIDQFITNYNRAVSAGKVSVDVKPVQRPADPSLEEDE